MPTAVLPSVDHLLYGFSRACFDKIWDRSGRAVKGIFDPEALTTFLDAIITAENSVDSDSSLAEAECEYYFSPPAPPSPATLFFDSLFLSCYFYLEIPDTHLG
jgi:hypothetical protein